ncbi:Hypothetical protein NTJ_13469 [Nesidiocoris tenuis]|uniref:Uncharacterized protein n=1 Tax=Nesidiocoris tenuis TaxID=355587 RepID=A0ABN7B8G0_9HEMI|nr:Hypothetical protein NTJ_13469 [Nesidiocoris tenuis]
MDGENYRVCIIPRGLTNGQSELSGGSVAVFAFKNASNYYGKVVNIPEPSEHKLNRPFHSKVHKIIHKLKKQPYESQMKIDYYFASWSASAADSFSVEYFGEDYISWYKHLLSTVPRVGKLMNLCQTDPSKLSLPLVNVLHWLLIGLKKPDIVRVSAESRNRLLPIFEIPPILRNSVDIFSLTSDIVDRAEEGDLLRMEYGFICEAAENVYSYLYHFSDVALEQYFVDKVDYTFKFPEWLSIFRTNAYQTVLVVEYNSEAAWFSNVMPKELDPHTPNVYYIRRTNDIRVSHVIRLKFNCVRLALPQKVLNLAGDALRLSSLFLLSACVVYMLAEKKLLIV